MTMMVRAWEKNQLKRISVITWVGKMLMMIRKMVERKSKTSSLARSCSK